MTVDDLPNLNPPDFGGVHDPRRPILSFAWRVEGPHRAAAHSHPRAHIIHPDYGALWVVTPEGRWLVPAGQAIWVPPAVHHEVYSHDTVSARVMFVDPAYAAALPAQCGTVRVSPLLAQLLRRAGEYGNEYASDGPGARLALVALDELAVITVEPLLLPVSQEPRLARAMEYLVSNPGSVAGIEEVARRSGASPRTLARLFKAEVGMTFTQWRTRLRLVESIERLERGASVTEVALDLGYASTSSFIFMFRTHLGASPGQYVTRGLGDR